MGKYQCVIPVVMVLLTLVTLSLAARTPNNAEGQLAQPARILKANGGGDDYDGDDFEIKSDRCQAKLDKGAPNCFHDVYFKNKLPNDRGECCKNLLKMDKEAHECWDYLFDDPASTLAFQHNIAKCH